MSELNEPGLFRVQGYMEIKHGLDGYVVRSIEDNRTFMMPSLDGYEPMNEQAEEMKLKELLSLGYRQAEGAFPEAVRGELLASGQNTNEVLVKALTALSKRLGISITVEQSSRTYIRDNTLKVEYKGGPSTTRVYLVNDGGRKAA